MIIVMLPQDPSLKDMCPHTKNYTKRKIVLYDLELKMKFNFRILYTVSAQNM